MIESDAIDKFDVDRVECIANQYADFKTINGLYDYTDMLVMANEADLEVPQLHTLFVDEAQDLSRLHWCIVDKLAAKSKHVVIAGDDKQSINGFAGADVDTFLSLDGTVETLKQSYRVPKQVYKMANKVTQYMTKYRAEGAVWEPREEEGVTIRVHDIPPSISQGEWFVLARASYQLDKYSDDLMTHKDKILFTVNGQWPVAQSVYDDVLLFQKVKQKGSIWEAVTILNSDSDEIRKDKVDFIKRMKKYVPCADMQPWEVDEEFKETLELPWYQIFTKLTFPQRRYVAKTLKDYNEKKEHLFDDVPVKLMTIHAAKGRECDNVVVLVDVPRSVQDTIRYKESDIEAKVFYTAITRAKKSLFLLSDKGYGITLDRYLI